MLRPLKDGDIMSQDQLSILQQLLRSANQAVLDAIDGIADEEARQVPAPGEWTVAQLLAHIAEIQYFWMEKAVLITKEDDPNITRSDVENDRRAAAVSDHAGDPLDDLIRALAAANESAIATAGEIAPEDLATIGHRGKADPNHPFNRWSHDEKPTRKPRYEQDPAGVHAKRPFE